MKEISTQTSSDNQPTNNPLHFHSQLMNEQTCVQLKNEHHLLKHQLTRDSGIDSDNTQQQKTTTQQLSRQNHVFQINPGETNENEKTPITYLNSTVTCSKSSTKGLKSLTIKSIVQSNDGSFNKKFSSSTRDNSIDGDMGQNDDSYDEEGASEGSKNAMINLFKKNVVDEDEYAGDEYIEDKYIGDEIEYGSEKEVDCESEGDDPVEREFKKLSGIEVSRHKVHNLCLNSTMDDSFGSTNDPFEANRVKIESSKPTISSTSMSKLATNIKKKKDYNLNSVSGLSIDQVLNLIDTKSAPSTTFTSAVASFWSKGKSDDLNKSNNDPNSQTLPQLARMRSIFKSSRANSMSQSQSFDEFSTLTTRSLMEHKLKTLESNFNQVAMAYHTDEQVLDSCITIYRDKYNKSSTHMNLLFDEISESLNRMAMFLHEENGQSLNESEFSSKKFNGKREVDGNGKKIPKKSKKFLQENLTVLSKELFQLKTKLLSLITTSSMIAGLKQEIHLSDLVKISISYVRELRRMQLLTTPPVNLSDSHTGRTTPMKRSSSITPQMFSEHDKANLANLGNARARTYSMQIEPTDLPGGLRKRNRWLQAMSSIKSLSASLSSAEVLGVSGEVSCGKEETILENEEVYVSSEVMEEGDSMSHLELGRSEFNTSVQQLGFINEENEQIRIETDASNINQLNETNDYLNSIDPQYALTPTTNDFTGSQKTRHLCISTARNSIKQFYSHIKHHATKTSDLVLKDSFLFVRKFMSLILLCFTIFFGLATVGTELGPRFLNYVLQKIEVRNYYESARTT